MLRVICIITEQFSVILCLFALYGKKFKLDSATIGIILINILTLYIRYFGILNVLTTILLYVFLFIYSLYEFDKNIKIAIVNNMLFLIIISVLQLVFNFSSVLLTLVTEQKVVIMILVNILVSITVSVFNRKIHKLSSSICSTRLLSIIPILICFVLAVMLLLRYKYNEILTIEMCAIGIVFLTLVVILVRKYCESIIESEKKQLEIEMLTVYNTAFKSLVNDLRRKQHDMKNHINAIYSQHYICKTYEELVESQKKYCEYIISSTKYDKLLSMSSVVMGGFLYSKFQYLDKEGINVEFGINMYSENIDIPIYELISVLGILIDNATEKTLSYSGDKEKKIIVLINESENQINFFVKNKCEYIKRDEILKMFEEGYSSKGEERGIGLFNIKEKSRKYGFYISVDNEIIQEENWICFGIIINKNFKKK